jgi:plasmid maintenance system antidote protein VapI
MTPDVLAALLERLDVSTRELARRLDVSAMWVSRRVRGEVPITAPDADRILEALAPTNSTS